MDRKLVGLVVALAVMGGAAGMELPVRGLHLSAPDKEDVPLLVSFIEEDLPREGVNVLVLEIGYGFRFPSHPELAAEGALDAGDVRALLRAARSRDIRLIPQLNCLGHQSWAEHTFPLLVKYPEFDETPGQYPNNEGIYCRSYCPLHPDVHRVVFALIDDLVTAFDAKDFHVGMDEVFLIASEHCPRCRGKDPAELFAGEVRALYDHLAEKGVRMWMWGDRFLDGKTTGIGKWEAAENGTHPAVDRVPKDIVICDWHYEYSPPTPGYFALKGFPVVVSPWRKTDVALHQLGRVRLLREATNPTLAERAWGVLQTTWCNPAEFVRAYREDPKVRSDSAREAAACFKALFKALREP
ncbi:MAG: family 20 glycosylhydrolase [Acidobacteriota bacterium]